MIAQWTRSQGVVSGQPGWTIYTWVGTPVVAPTFSEGVIDQQLKIDGEWFVDVGEVIQDQLAIDGEFFTDPDVFGEQITYTSQGAAGTLMNAYVHRFGPGESVPTSGGITATMEILIRNHATDTKGRTSINIGGDTVTVAERYGGSTAVRMVVDAIEQDNGMWLLRVN